MITPDYYQEQTAETEIYTDAALAFVQEILRKESLGLINRDAVMCLSIMYCTGKINGESGEVAEIIFKNFRGNLGVLTEQEKILLAKELGDILWYVSRIADLIDYKLSDIMYMNLQKLRDRKDRGVIHGYGDDR